MTIKIGPYVAGEVPETLEYQFLDSDGVAVDLTGFTATFVASISGTATANTAATVTTPAEGRVTHTWVADELTAGVLTARFWATNGTNTYASDLIEAHIASF